MEFDGFEPCKTPDCEHAFAVEEYEIADGGFGGTEISPPFTTPEDAIKWLDEHLAEWKSRPENSGYALRIARSHHAKPVAQA